MGNFDLIWAFLTGGLAGQFVLAAIVVAGILLLTLVFQAACALADVQTPNFFFSLLIVLLTVALLAPLNGVIVYGYCHTPVYAYLPGWISASLLAMVGFILCVIVLAALYIPILRIGVKKSLLTGVLEQLLGLLLFSLIYAAFLVVLALVQIVNKQATKKEAQTPPAKPTVAIVVPS